MTDRTMQTVWALGFLFYGMYPAHATDSRAISVQPAPASIKEALQAIEAKDGVHFSIDGDLGRDPVAIPTGKAWSASDIPGLLKGYNWLGTYAKGQLSSIRVTGRNGDGADNPSINQSTALLRYRKGVKLSARYSDLPPGAVLAIDIPVEQLREMAKGAHVALDLPEGKYDLQHDNAWDHKDGNKTWVGKIAGANPGNYRTLITLGDGNVVDGQIRTPNNLYLVESDANGQWLVDVNASGLQSSGFDTGGQAAPLWLPSTSPTGVVAGAGTSYEQLTGMAGSPASNPSQSGLPGTTQVDVLLLYPADMVRPNLKTRLNTLMSMANQAMVDSQAHVLLNLSGVKQVDYPDNGDTGQALSALTSHQGALSNVGKLRSRAGADLVLLVRDFRPRTQGNYCGEAWVNGSEGSELSASLAYGVISDGRSDGYYCSGYTLAHEVGHLLGASHDRQHARVPGHFSYSYGYGIPGKFGTIMSYIDPEVGLFANPDLQICDGQACGIAMGQPKEADVAATFNQTVRQVAGFVNPHGN